MSNPEQSKSGLNIPAIKYIVIDDVTTANHDRICFYFGFANNVTHFAAKSSIQGVKSAYKATNFLDVFAWMGFSTLSMALYNSPKFQKKYRVNVVEVIEGQLVAGTVNSSPIFFFKTDIQSDLWSWTETVEDLTPSFGEDIESKINQVFGKDFLIMYGAFTQENKAQAKAHENYLEFKKSEELQKNAVESEQSLTAITA